MEISSTILEQALRGVNELALPVAGVSCLYLMVYRRVRPVAKPSAPAAGPCSALVRRGVSALGLLVSLSSPVAAAEGSGSRRASPRILDLRSEPGRFPPPRLPGPAEPPVAPGDGPPRAPVRRGEDPPWERAEADPREAASDHREAASDHREAVPDHPAIHGGRPSSPPRPLFPRLDAEEDERRDRAPARPGRLGWHAVLPGDSLWSIAAQRLHTDDVRRIARYWPRIHRANREVIGSNPNLLRPGQVLELPPEHA